MSAPLPADSAEDLYENTPCGYLSTLPDGTIIRVNQTFLNLTGHSREELLAGRRVQELMTVPGRIFYETHFAPLLRMQGSVKEIACDLLRPGRAPLPALLNAVAVRDEGGQLTQIRFIAFDATDRRRYEKELLRARQSAEHYAAIVKASADAILSIGPDDRVQTWNAGAERLFGYSAAEAVGRPVLELIVPEGGAEEFATARAELAAGRAVQRETVCTGRDGRRLDISLSLTPHIEPPGELTGVSAILRDITERKSAEAALRESDQRIRLATEATGVGIWEWNLSTGQVRWDAQMFRIYGIPSTADGFLPYDVWRQTVLPGDSGPQEAVLPETLHRVGHRHREFHIRRADNGQCRHIESVQAVRTNAHGEAEWIVGTNLDITERRQAEAELKQAKEAAEAANRSKDSFLAVLSHELRTPLTPVLMTVASLEHDPSLRPEVREDLVMIKRNIELETKLIDDLLDVTRIVSGKIVLKTELLDLNTAVRHVCESSRPQAAAAEVRLEVDLHNDAGVVLADPSRLQQVLWNILKNALKFTPARGSIQVTSTRLSPERCAVLVRDSGIGIPEEVLPRIFDPFEQGEAGVTRDFGGLGLGLAISKALIDLHGGSIRAESAGRGQGATFIIELPREEGALPQAIESPTRDAAASRQLRLLVVEDHPDTARILRRLLLRAGFAVTNAHDVASALDLAAHETFDVLISDLGLPDGTGHDVMNGVRKLQPIPGIAMSGYGMEDDLRLSEAAGFDEHIVKPIEVQQLIAAIRRVVETKAQA